MVQSSHRREAPYLALWTGLAVVFVAALGMFAFVHAPEATQNYGVTFSDAGWAAVALFCASVTSVTVARFLVLPAIARRKDASPERIVTLGYLLAILPALYGLAAVVLSGEGWFGVPFSLMALFATLDLWVYFAVGCRAGQSQEVWHEAGRDMRPAVDIDEGTLTESALSYVRSVQNVDRLVNLVLASLRAPRGSR